MAALNMEFSDASFLGRDGRQVRTFRALNAFADPIQECLAMGEPVRVANFDSDVIQVVVDAVHAPSTRINYSERLPAEVLDLLRCAEFLGVNLTGRLSMPTMTTENQASLYRIALDMRVKPLLDLAVCMQSVDGGASFASFMESNYQVGDLDKLHSYGVLVPHSIRRGHLRIMYMGRSLKHTVPPLVVARLLLAHGEVDAHRQEFALSLANLTAEEADVRALAELVVARGTVLSADSLSALVRALGRSPRRAKRAAPSTPVVSHRDDIEIDIEHTEGMEDSDDDDL